MSLGSNSNNPPAAAPSLAPQQVMDRPDAASVMTPAPRTCSPFSTVTEAVMLFRDEDCGLVPIVDAGKPVGVLTDRDVALALAQYPDLASRPVSDVMSEGPITVTPATPIDQVVQAFLDNHVRRLLVVDEENLLVGVISWFDITPWLSFQMAGHMVAETLEEPTS
jgi:CBS domain-containing protein